MIASIPLLIAPLAGQIAPIRVQIAPIRVQISSLTIPQKLAKAELITSSLTGNASFPTPPPALATFVVATGELGTAYSEAQTARQTAKEKTIIQNQKEAALDVLFNQLPAYVESIAGDNSQLIFSAGMNPRAAAVATTDTPPQPQGLEPTAGDHDGEIDLSWDTVSGARSYVIERTLDPGIATSWSYCGVSTKSALRPRV